MSFLTNNRIEALLLMGFDIGRSTVPCSVFLLAPDCTASEGKFERHCMKPRHNDASTGLDRALCPGLLTVSVPGKPL